MTNKAEQYTVGWICAISVEYVIACELLDEEYERTRAPVVDDQNSYTFGRFHEHHAVITCLAKGRYGTTSAAIAAERMRKSFPAIRINLMVGIAGGVPSVERHDIRLGDVVVSVPERKHSGVIQYDFGKSVQQQEFQEMGHLSPPPDTLLCAVHHLESQHKRKGSKMIEIMDKALLKNERLKEDYSLPLKHADRLYHRSYLHEEQNCDCEVTYEQNDIDASDDARLIRRETRVTQGPVLHYGLIASANQLIKNALLRDTLAEKYDLLCFEMEAAGLMNSFNCVVIRGISDYADTHKNNMWQGYAAATAAAYAKELIEVIPGPIGTRDQPSAKHDELVSSSPRFSPGPSQISIDPGRFDIGFTLRGVPLAKKFIGREAEMRILKDNLLPDIHKRRKLFVLRGLGGIGKTQLAVEFMRSCSTKFSAVLWINAGSEECLQKDLAKAASRIRSKSGWNNNLVDEAGYKVAAQVMLDWLSIPDNNRWLLVYDNLDRAWYSSCSNSVGQDIQQYLPAADHGSIIITTRLLSLEQLGESYELNGVDSATTHGILRSWYKKDYGTHESTTVIKYYGKTDFFVVDKVDGERLFECLGGLPLAIAQAGAYLQQSAQGVKKYLQLYERKHSEIANLIQVWKTPLLDYSDRCMWTTWTISFEAVREQDEHAANMLVLWSFLDRKDLFYGLFESAIVNTFEDDDKQFFVQTLSRWLGKAAFEETAFDSTMRLLRSYSLIEGFAHIEGYNMHPLVHRWTQLHYGQQHRELNMLALAVAGLAVPLSTHPNCARLQLRLLHHAQMCSNKLFSEPELYGQQITEHMRSQATRYTVKGIHKLGDLFVYNSKLDQAEQMYGLALRVAEEFFTENDELELDALYNLSKCVRQTR